MLDNLIFSLNIVIPIFLVIVLGYFLKKRGILGEGFLKGGNKVVFMFGIPANLFISLYTAEISDIFDIGFVIFAVVFTLLSFAAIWIYGLLFIKNKDLTSAFVQGAFRSNLAVLGLPLWIYILGEQAAARGALILVFVIPIYNILTILVLTAHSKTGKKMTLRGTLLSIVKNPPIIGITLGIIFSFLPISLPTMAYTTIRYLATLATPLALICLGVAIVYKGIDDRFKVALLSSLIKIVALPLIATVTAYLVGFRGDNLTILMIMAGVPSAVAGYTMVEQLGGDGRTASSVVVFSTLLSAISLTIFIYAFRSLGIIAGL
ncbi:MAG: AEC family transporter [Defluviitaleaceae bacterium]|nr:AEC family transporter [Defluviitaleaceae bacterium]